MSPTVTSVTVRMALKKLAEITCGFAPSSVRVSVVPSGAHRVYVTSIPFEFRAEVYHYLAEHTSIRVPVNGDPLVLSGDEATALVNLAYRAGQEEMRLA
ncbi:MAG TPA: hypothetical protein VMH26_18560 [Burkholderiales bacterium]|nr:hypothetical protein [Burkholderiales bacterium]